MSKRIKEKDNFTKSSINETIECMALFLSSFDLNKDDHFFGPENKDDLTSKSDEGPLFKQWFFFWPEFKQWFFIYINFLKKNISD